MTAVSHYFADMARGNITLKINALTLNYTQVSDPCQAGWEFKLRWKYLYNV